jgi:hypothetical protein
MDHGHHIPVSAEIRASRPKTPNQTPLFPVKKSDVVHLRLDRLRTNAGAGFLTWSQEPVGDQGKTDERRDA